MPLIRFVEADGTAHTVDAAVGQSLKQAALDHLVPGIIGDCGGCASCGTCHAYVDEKFLPSLPPADGNEDMILDGVPAARAHNSRLTCQIPVTDDMSGMVVHIPDAQL
ncbi:2Fe-2S iron-sulfur cluster-binding protein [Streptomyces spongiae]|uniref:2Fe-2S iron-sulfur cluster binding domain-containing protein n=1 Tax=Streptomyces spongiae TaxID=565072 RepID=A0A5N8X901_9ACTN|nr:2Fe-2S iron-sulfur cluster-binding protein [Streptomyces spongiae]MPY55913.1 2Fe-2S iron-sulfur cluster binding domain-containing protein [Streptomyces spongiae]